VLPTWTLPIVSVGAAALPFTTPAPEMPWLASPAAMRRLPAPEVITLARRLKALPLPKFALS
jgi:hypothetical protein